MWTDVPILLRAEDEFAVGRGAVPWGRILRLVLACGSLYGSVMGSLAGFDLGTLYSALKVPILLTFSLCICLPNFYVVNAVLGLRADFPAALRGILAAQGTVAIALACMSPVTVVVYASSVRYPTALLWNGLVFALALVTAHGTLARHYRPLVARDPRHRVTLTAWFCLYGFVAIKVGWVLRPFVGDPAQPLEFLREGKWLENPYVTLFWTVTAFVVTSVRKVLGVD